MVVRVYIGRLCRDARERDVENFFKGYGRITEVSLKDGYGFVNFEDDRDADDAVYDLNGKELCGERVIIERARSPNSKRDTRGGTSSYAGRRGTGSYPARRSFGRDRGRYSDFRPRNPPPVRTENRVLIENLSSRVSWQDLKDLMKRVGDVTFADAHKIRPGDGVVEFASSSDVRRAIEKYDGYEFEGRKIKVTDAKRSRSHSGSRSRERSRSRSRSSSRDRRGSPDRSDRQSFNRSRDDENDSEKSGSRKRERDSQSASPQKKYARSHSPSPAESNN